MNKISIVVTGGDGNSGKLLEPPSAKVDSVEQNVVKQCGSDNDISRSGGGGGGGENGCANDDA